MTKNSAPKTQKTLSLTRLSAGHPLIAIACWTLAVTGALFLSFSDITGERLTDRLESSWSWAQSESTRADELLVSGTTTSTLLIYGIAPENAELAELLRALRDELAALGEVELIDPLVLPPGTPLPPALSSLIANDAQGVLLVARTHEQNDAVDARLIQEATTIRNIWPDIIAEVGSQALLIDSVIALSESDLQRGEAVALPIALLVMLLVFGGFLSAGLPLVGALSSIAGGLGALYGFTFFMEVNTPVMNVVTVIGLGLSIDYGLLIVSRFREESRSHPERSRLETIVRSGETAGRTVLYSGTVFALTALGLLFFDSVMVRAIALGALAVTAIAVLSALSLIPSLLSLGGDALLKPGLFRRIPRVGLLVNRFGDIAPDEGFFSKLTRRVGRHPALVTLACTAILLLFSAPALQLRMAITSADTLPASSEQYLFSKTLNEHFPQLAEARVTLVTESLEELNRWREEVTALAHVLSVSEPEPVNQVWRSRVQIEPKTGASVVQNIRETRENNTLLVTGTDARTLDFAATLSRGAPWAALVIALATVILLFLLTGSLIVPLKALIMSVLSLGASLGVLVWGFQEGNFAGLMNFAPEDVFGVDIVVLLLTLIFGFGLAMDYEMFLLSRITEQVERGVPNLEAIAKGMQRSGRIITSAALIIVVVFAGFATGDLMMIKQLGTALAVAVFLDATLVRCLLVPAFMTWQQKIMWWAPAPLKRLHARFALRER